MTEPNAELPKLMEPKIAKGLFWLGVVLIVFGALAIAFPLATTIATKMFIGWIFLITGAFQIWQSFSTREWGGFFWNLLIGIMYLAVGAWLSFNPLTGIISLTILLAITFIIHGVIECVMAYNLRPEKGWGWLMFSGLISALVGVLILSELPSTAAWAIGLLVGINLISSGFAFVTLGSIAKKLS
jgi:uncharacterized membrane protein HdeD (DUF308 family)